MRSFLFILTLLFAHAGPSGAQNLIQNGDFESHGKLDCIQCPMFDAKFAAVIPPWNLLNGIYPFICDCQFKKEAAANNNGICDFSKISPHSGCNMMQFEYSPSCLDQNHETRGCSAYLSTKLPKALDIGKVYEVSFWLYIVPPHPTDADYTQFIGLNFYPKALRNPTGKMLESAAFQIDTIILGRWYPVKWLVRPVCALQFLVLGVFRGDEDPPVNTDGRHNRFYIDDVALQEVTGAQAESAAIVPYCRFSKKEKEEIPDEVEGSLCLFESNDSLLLPLAIQNLDAFAVRAKAHPTAAFYLTGRTDSVGSNHRALSQARMESVLNYLEKKHGIQRFRFLPIGLGTESPLADNSTEAGRQQNRSVQISQLDCPMDLMVYRQVLTLVFAQKKTEAFKTLNIWLHLAPDRKKMLALFDPRLSLLQSDPKWEAVVVKKVRESYQNQANPALAYALDYLGLEDQKCRTLDRYLENMHTYMAYPDSLEPRWNVAFACDTGALAEKQDEAHVQALIGWIGKDWPKISEVGKRPTKTAFLIISHTSDTSIMAQYLPLLKKNCEAGEAEWIHFATLFDRLQVHRGLPQRFGTQFRPPASEAEKPEPFPLENLAMLNVWRRELGLEEIEI